MNIAIITAAGKGTRANLGVPKQFYKVNSKEIIAYTIEAFEKCQDVDCIILVLPEERLDVFGQLKSKYHFNKLYSCCPGGETNELSIFEGFREAKRIAKDDDIIIIHDGVRCLVNSDIIENNIRTCKKYGNAITTIPCNEAMLFSAVDDKANIVLDRTKIFKTQTPHSIFFKKGYKLLESSIEKGITNSVALCTLLVENNEEVYFSKGSNINFKITNPEDIFLFKSMLSLQKENN